MPWIDGIEFREHLAEWSGRLVLARFRYCQVKQVFKNCAISQESGQNFIFLPTGESPEG